jgi:hypothetical protein
MKYAIILLGFTAAALAQQPAAKPAALPKWDHIGSNLSEGVRYDAYIDERSIHFVKGDSEHAIIGFTLKTTPWAGSREGYTLEQDEVDLATRKILMRTATVYGEDGHQYGTMDFTKPINVPKDVVLPKSLADTAKGGEKWEDVPAGSKWEAEYNYIKGFVDNAIEELKKKEGRQ